MQSAVLTPLATTLASAALQEGTPCDPWVVTLMNCVLALRKYAEPGTIVLYLADKSTGECLCVPPAWEHSNLPPVDVIADDCDLLVRVNLEACVSSGDVGAVIYSSEEHAVVALAYRADVVDRLMTTFPAWTVDDVPRRLTLLWAWINDGKTNGYAIGDYDLYEVLWPMRSLEQVLKIKL